MNIKIAERLRPFSHLPGTSTLLPGSGYHIQIFPCFIRIFSLLGKQPILVAEVSLKIKGPIEQFTVFNDLEKGRLSVTGQSIDGWFNYHLIGENNGDGICFFLDRCSSSGLIIREGCREFSLKAKESCMIIGSKDPFKPYEIPSIDRLSLGSHKKQDWEMIKRRKDLTEIFPLIHRLGQLLPKTESAGEGGFLDLMERVKESLILKRESLWRTFLLSAFQDLLVPQLDDLHYQGVLERPFKGEGSPLFLLIETAKLIGKLFIESSDHHIKILPNLFPSFHSGRLINVKCEYGTFCLEWTKKTIRRLIFNCHADNEICFHFPSNVKTFRLRELKEKKGIICNCNQPLSFNSERIYLFDNFKQ